MNITILTYGSRGDVQPFLPLSAKLISRGHSVKLAAPSRFKNLVESHGIKFVSLPGDPSTAILRINDARNNIFKMMREGFAHALEVGADVFQQSAEACADADLIIHAFSHAVDGHTRAREMNIPVSEYSQLLDEIRPAAFICLDAACPAQGENSSLYEVVPNADEDGPAEEASRHELKQVILDRLKELPDMQRKVLALYYGEDLHLREIAEVFGLTESRICQIHSQAILSIRAYLQRFEGGMVDRLNSLKRP